MTLSRASTRAVESNPYHSAFVSKSISKVVHCCNRTKMRCLTLCDVELLSPSIFGIAKGFYS